MSDSAPRLARWFFVLSLFAMFLLSCGDKETGPEEDDGTTPVDSFPVPVWSVEYGARPADGISDLWGTAGDDVFAVGGGGLILHYDGAGWSEMESGTDRLLSAVWGFGSSDVFAVGGEGTLLRYDGAFWKLIANPARSGLNDVWGTDPEDLWVAGNEHQLLHFDGESWTDEDPGLNADYHAVWGIAGDTVFAGAGNNWHGYVLENHGEGWTEILPGALGPLYGLWGTSTTNLVATAFGTELGVSVFSYDGTAWTLQDVRYGHIYGSVWGLDATHVFAALGRSELSFFDGGGWSVWETGTSMSIRTIWGPSMDDLFAGSSEGGIAHYDGTIWTVQRKPLVGGLSGVWVSPTGDVFAVGTGGILQRRAGEWQELPRPIVPNTSHAFLGVYGFSDDDVYAVGYGISSDSPYPSPRVFHWDGESWFPWADHFGFGIAQGVWGMPGGDLFVVGDETHDRGIAYRFDSSGGVESFPTGRSSLHGVGGVAPEDVWAVGSYGTIRHFDGEQWSSVESGTDMYLLDVWGDDERVVAVGSGGILVRGEWGWRPSDVAPHGTFNGVCGNDAGDLYAVTAYGDVFSSSW